MKFLKNKSVQIFITILLFLAIEPYISINISCFLYSLSYSMKDILITFMPLSILFYVSATISSYDKKASIFVLSLIMFEATSNFLCSWYGYFCADFSNSILPNMERLQVNKSLDLLWQLPKIQFKFWKAEYAMFLGLFLGFVAAYTNNNSIKFTVTQGKKCVDIFLIKVFSNLLPIFLLGFVANIYHTNIFASIGKTYIIMIGYLILFILIYAIILFLISNNFNIKKTISNIKNVLPATLISFTSGCSLSTMPWTIACTAKNLKNSNFAEAVIPLTTNIQQVGDCIANCFICYIIYTHYFNSTPDILMWLNFSIAFVIVRFSTTAITGGAIFLMLPVYINYLNFNEEMIAIILALNVILDPFITSSNVTANCALCKIFEKLMITINALPPLKQKSS